MEAAELKGLSRMEGEGFAMWPPEDLERLRAFLLDRSPDQSTLHVFYDSGWVAC